MQRFAKKPLIFLLLMGGVLLIVYRHRPVHVPETEDQPEAKVLIAPKPQTPEATQAETQGVYHSDLSSQEEAGVPPVTTEISEAWGKALFEGELKIEDSRLALQKIYKTPLKYPLIMVQHLWQTSDTDPSLKEYLGERKMVADHLVVRLHNADDRPRFEQLIAGDGMVVRKEMYSPGMFLVSFPVEEVDSFQKAQAKLSAMPEVKSATPDIFGRGF